ncbi:unnamed protein product [Parascedosporium putredinis]|uniref:Ribonucleases P/MRP subunit Pop8-like domain-containing protein n=1 Tax=Parascedosporium putredinis TaxID=1442378 RepID=A0A9P1GU54_9PEZI|nr:unnamed protein product [Parascedosporium putredinis]CAI7987420.1 unnamed protein product [Parascedosporium putredinis]
MHEPITCTNGSREHPLKRQKSTEIRTHTIRSPPFAYAHLELSSSSPSAAEPAMDALQARSYCASALTRFLGDTGSAVSVDVLRVRANRCWVRVPAPDLAAFSAAITAWPGTTDGGERVALKILQCSDWLGCMVGRDGQGDVGA